MIVYNPMSGSWMNIPDVQPAPAPPPQVPQTPTNNNYSQLSDNILPYQQLLTADGKASIDKIRMRPNSSVPIFDNTAPIVWICVSDGLGNVTSTPYDLLPHEENKSPAPSTDSFEERLSQLENLILEMGEKLDGKSSSGTAKSEPTKSSSRAN